MKRSKWTSEKSGRFFWRSLNLVLEKAEEKINWGQVLTGLGLDIVGGEFIND